MLSDSNHSRQESLEDTSNHRFRWSAGLTQKRETLFPNHAVDGCQLSGVEHPGPVTDASIPDMVVVQQRLAIVYITIFPHQARFLQISDLPGEAPQLLNGICLYDFTDPLKRDFDAQVGGDI